MSVPVATLTFGNGVHVEVRVAGETLMGLLDKVKASRANYINASLQWLKPLGKDVVERAAAYVRHGTHESVLAEIAAGNRLALNNWEARHPVTKLVSSGQLDAAGWIRLGQVWNAAAPNKPGSSWQKNPPAPTSRIEDAADELVKVVHFYEISGRRSIGVTFLRQVLAAAGYEGSEARGGVLAFQVRQTSVGKYNRVDVEGGSTLIETEVDSVATLLRSPAIEVRLGTLELLILTPSALPQHVERLIELSRDSSKKVRDAALNALDRLPEELRQPALQAAYDAASPAIARSIEPRLARRDSSPLADAVPPPVELLPVSDASAGFVDHVLRAIERSRAQFTAAFEKDPKSLWMKDRLQELDRLDRPTVEAIARALGAPGKASAGVRNRPIYAVAQEARNVPGLTLRHAIRLAVLSENHNVLSFVADLHAVDADLRSVAAAITEAVGERSGPGNHASATPYNDAKRDPVAWGVLSAWSPVKVDNSDHLWPFFAERLEILERELGMRPAPSRAPYQSENTGRALEILAAFPRLPRSFVPRIEELALGDGTTHRIAAQDLLTNQGGLDLALRGLSATVAAVRATAARWLVRIVSGVAEGDRDATRERAVQALTTAVQGEKRELAEAAMLGSLRALGTDLSTFVSPASLEASATTGLKKKAPAGMEWVPLDALPAVRWADGSAVEPAILRWWTTLAVKLKDPAGEGLLPLYVSLLDEPSQRALGSFVLRTWVGHDLRRMSDEEIQQEAATQAPVRHSQYQQWAQRSPNEWSNARAALSLSEVEREITRELQGAFLGSAVKEKGLLALTSGAPGHEITDAITRYSKRHPERRSQVENLVIAASTNDDPAALQAVISIARNFKQRTVREKAAELVELIAARRGWSTDELADRTIPTAGFPTASEAAAGTGETSENGTAILDYGSRHFTMRIGDDLALALFTADDKPLKALPKPGVKDDADLAKAARSTVTAAKKELTQVVALQTTRLQEAMALGRTWTASTWREAFSDHPVMRHLISRLVWVTGPVGEDGSPLHVHDGDAGTLFAPTLDGDILDASDGEVDLDAGAHVWLAHASRLGEGDAQIWRDRLADYGVTPLFEQLTVASPTVAPDATQISDRQGWVLTVGALKTRTAKQNFRLAAAEDGGWIGSMVKELGPWTATIEMTGTYPGQAATESIALTHLSLARSGRDQKLDQVPPVLLSVIYNDYLAIAEGGTFDPDWAKRTGW